MSIFTDYQIVYLPYFIQNIHK